MKHGRLEKSPTGLGQTCEEFRLLELKREYASFIADIESEATLLEHIHGCRRCREGVKQRIEKGDHDDRWSKLFSRELPIQLGDARGIIPGDAGECPAMEDYADIYDFIKERIRWRVERLMMIRSDAEVELLDIVASLNEKKAL